MAVHLKPQITLHDLAKNYEAVTQTPELYFDAQLNITKDPKLKVSAQIVVNETISLLDKESKNPTGAYSQIRWRRFEILVSRWISQNIEPSSIEKTQKRAEKIFNVLLDPDAMLSTKLNHLLTFTKIQEKTTRDWIHLLCINLLFERLSITEMRRYFSFLSKLQINHQAILDRKIQVLKFNTGDEFFIDETLSLEHHRLCTSKNNIEAVIKLKFSTHNLQTFSNDIKAITDIAYSIPENPLSSYAQKLLLILRAKELDIRVYEERIRLKDFAKGLIGVHREKQEYLMYVPQLAQLSHEIDDYVEKLEKAPPKADNNTKNAEKHAEAYHSLNTTSVEVYNKQRALYHSRHRAINSTYDKIQTAIETFLKNLKRDKLQHYYLKNYPEKYSFLSNITGPLPSTDAFIQLYNTQEPECTLVIDQLIRQNVTPSLQDPIQYLIEQE